jgi:hypothetical protein
MPLGKPGVAFLPSDGLGGSPCPRGLEHTNQFFSLQALNGCTFQSPRIPFPILQPASNSLHTIHPIAPSSPVIHYTSAVGPYLSDPLGAYLLPKAGSHAMAAAQTPTSTLKYPPSSQVPTCSREYTFPLSSSSISNISFPI